MLSCVVSVDAPGWAEHMSLHNRVYCFTNPQPFSMSSSLTHLDCCPHCGSDENVKELCLKEYPCLESIHIDSYSFPHILSVEVGHLPKLKQFVVEDHCFMHPGTVAVENACCVEDCPLLESITMGVGSFYEYSTFSLRRDELECALKSRFASAEVTVCGR